MNRQELLKRLKGHEWTDVEFKEARRDVPKSACETVYAVGTLKGIYRFEKEGESEFREWATDVPAETFGFLLDAWRKDAGDENRKRMNEFIAGHCPDWADWAAQDRTG